MSRRYVVVGAGAVGAALAAGLADAGRAVVLVSRGATFTTIRERGLRYSHAGRERTLGVAVYDGHDSGLALTESDILVLATKTQDVAEAVARWAALPVRVGAGGQRTAGGVLPIVLLQNGLEAERLALRHFARVLSATTFASARHIEAGVVTVESSPHAGRLVLGAYPSSEAAPEAAALVPSVAADFHAARWAVHVTEDPLPVAAWKTARAATFAVTVLAGGAAELDELRERQFSEAIDVLRAAGYPTAPPPDLPAGPETAGPYPSPARVSTWQSFQRGSGSEVDFLAGEIVLQARRVGRPAPVNTAIQLTLAAAAAAGEGPGVRTAAEVRALAAELAAAADTAEDGRIAS